ncbi:hypothetical protein HRbin30_02970 [bacterium HR30]|nr:hypothetical protein HRbin30_02970 [bacterium HR30]
MRMRTVRVLSGRVVAGLVTAAFGLSISLPSLAAGQVSEAAMKEAKEIWQTRCATCHGTGGKGDGPAGAALNPKPRDLTSEEWQKSVTDDYIEKIIVGGGQAVGKSPLMAANPDLAGKPEVVRGLTRVVRDLKGK